MLFSVNETVSVIFPGLSQPVPIVPLTEANEEAMDNNSFRKLLRKLGLRPPANEQVYICTSGLLLIIIIIQCDFSVLI